MSLNFAHDHRALRRDLRCVPPFVETSHQECTSSPPGSPGSLVWVRPGKSIPWRTLPNCVAAKNRHGVLGLPLCLLMSSLRGAFYSRLMNERRGRINYDCSIESLLKDFRIRELQNFPNVLRRRHLSYTAILRNSGCKEPDVQETLRYRKPV